MKRLKLRRTGNSLSTIWPRDMLARLNVKEGDELYAIETLHGVMVTPYDPKFEKAMETTRQVMSRDRDALKELAKVMGGDRDVLKALSKVMGRDRDALRELAKR